MLKKLRWKFVLVNMGIVISMLLVIFGLMFQYTKAELDDESEKALQILSQSTTGPEVQSIQMPYFILDVSIHGTVTISGSAYQDLNDAAFIQELIQTVYTADRITGEIEKYELRYKVIPGLFSQSLIFVDVSGHRLALKSLVQSFIFVGIGALGAFLLISFLLSKWAVRPVEKAWKQQKQFVSDASHELKTPLTVIMSNAELLQNPEFNEESKNQFAGSILVMTRQMRNLVDGLLELARADNGQVKKAFTTFNLSEALTDALLPFEPVFYEKGLLLESSLQPDIMVKGSDGYLRQVLEILLDNAAKYSSPGLVQVVLQKQGRGHCLLTVSNPGIPIDPKDRKRIFERFYRADEARSRDGSFGLGLSIAAAVVEEHKGKIWVESNETGNRFCVQLPCL